jgi:hypothetical protein
MLGAYAVAAALGLLLGLRFKIPAVAVLSGLVVMAGTAIGPFFGWSVLGACAAAFGASFTLQCGYFLGLSLQCFASRPKSWPRIVKRYIRGYVASASNARAH